MSLKINARLASAGAARALAENQQRIEKSAEQIASGKRIVRAGIDPTGLAISTNLKAHAHSTKQAEQNSDVAEKLVQVAEGALNDVSNHMIRMRELAIQSASDTLSDQEREFIDQEFQALISEVDRIANVTTFNGIQLINGQGPNDVLEFQVGVDADENSRLSYRLSDFDARASEVGITGLEIDSASSARSALDTIDEGLVRVHNSRAKLGALGNRLNSISDRLNVEHQHTEAARSRIADTDLAEASSEFISAQIRQQAAAMVFAQSNSISRDALALIKP